MGVPYHYRSPRRGVFCSNFLLVIRRPTAKYVSIVSFIISCFLVIVFFVFCINSEFVVGLF